jgi:hypothetical protein
MVQTGSVAGAITAAALLAANPNLLYLQSTPMTEPLMLATVFLVLLWLYEWAEEVSAGPAEAGHYVPVRLRVALFASAWTRYEAWLILAAALAATALVLSRRGTLWSTTRLIARLAAWPAAAAAVFVLNSRMSTGRWLVTGGFYEIDPTYHGLPLKALIAVWWGTHRLSGYVVESVALAVAGWLVAIAWRAAIQHSEFRMQAAVGRVLLLAPFAAAVLPFYAFIEGHPFRVRYMIVLSAACATLCGLAVALVRHRVAAVAFAVFLVAASLIESPPWSLQAAMIEEAQWDVPRTIERRSVTDCFRGGPHGEKILASMGSLAHYMQELSAAGIDIADFIHEGNGRLWELALADGAAAHAGWMIVEEQSEGGDVLARRVRQDVTFANGMDRACAAGGVALYKRR